MIVKRLRIPLAVALGGVLLSGTACGGEVDGTAAATQSQPSTRVIPSNLKPPKQVSPGPRVTFDPCLDIDDATLRRADIDPSTRKRNDTVAEQTFLDCLVDSPDVMISIIATNKPWGDVKEDVFPPVQNISINGREALMGRNGYDNESCTLAMRVTFGALIIDGSPRDQARQRGVKTCDGFEHIATVIEPLLPKGK